MVNPVSCAVLASGTLFGFGLSLSTMVRRPPKTMAEIGLRERQKEKRKQAIMVAAAKLFQAQGFNAASMEDIAAAALYLATVVVKYLWPARQMRAAEVEKYDGGRLLIEGAGGTLVVGGAGELINWFLAWLGTPPGNGAQQGLISAWVMRNFALLRSVPHIILGLALAVGAKPTPRSGMINDGLHEGGKALATAGAARFIDWMRANKMDRAASADEVAQKLATVTAQLAAAQAQINKQKQG